MKHEVNFAHESYSLTSWSHPKNQRFYCCLIDAQKKTKQKNTRVYLHHFKVHVDYMYVPTLGTRGPRSYKMVRIEKKKFMLEHGQY